MNLLTVSSPLFFNPVYKAFTKMNSAAPVWAEPGCKEGRGAWRQGGRGQTAAGSTRCSYKSLQNPPQRWPGHLERPKDWTISTGRWLEEEEQEGVNI